MFPNDRQGREMGQYSHWSWYREHLQKYSGSLILFGLFGAGMAALNLPLLWHVYLSLDEALANRDLAPLFAATGLLLACRVAIAVTAVAISWRSAPILRQIGANMRIEIVEALHTRLWQDVAAMEDASIQAKLIHDTERVERMTQALFNSVMPQLLPLAGYAVLAAILSWQLTLLALVLGIILRFATQRAHRALHNETLAFQLQYEVFHIDIVRVLFMLQVSILLGHERASVARFAQVTRRLSDFGARLSRTTVLTEQLSGLTSVIVISTLALAGGAAVMHGMMTAGALITFLVILRLAHSTISSILAAVPLIVAGDGALSHLDLLRERRRSIDAADIQAPGPAFRLELQDVSFAYGSRSILDRVTMAVSPGHVTAIVAPNGTGKTTLLDIAAGVLLPDLGGASWVGPHGESLNAGQCRRFIGVVPQHPRFFHASYRDNILCHRTDIAPTDLALAIEQAGLAIQLDRQPNGLDGIVVDGGQLLSGGERQRLALARALANRPRLLILDEPTNHLDDASVSEIFDAIMSQEDPPAILLATHDQRMLRRADTIFRLDNGRLLQCSANDCLAIS